MDGERIYRVGRPGLVSQEGIQLILETASACLSLDNDGRPTNGPLFDGFALALGSLLHSDEEDAHLVLEEAISGNDWVVLALEPVPGAPDEVWGPYSRPQAARKRRQLAEVLDYQLDRLAIKRLLS